MLLLLLACQGDIGVAKVTAPPAVSILSPVDGQEVTEGDAVIFSATVIDRLDEPDQITIVWESSIDGVLSDAPLDADGRSDFASATLSLGRHAITLTATDSDADTATSAVAVEVLALAEVPTVTFVRPLPGDTGAEGVSSEISLQLTDADADVTALLVQVSSDRDGEVCAPAVDGMGVAICQVTLSVGEHILTAVATDADGNEALAEAYYEVISGDEIDDDADGYTESEGDCDDRDASVYPTADELPGGVDDDCDGLIDEGTTDYDDDGDGYTEVGGDCDDAAAEVHPFAVEICDGVDGDCDDTIDEDTSCGDDDADGYSELDGDCDDTDTNVSPDGVEVVDGVDQDCDGLVDQGTDSFDDDGDCACEETVCTGSINVGCPTVEPGDCDDVDPAVGPEATELCDGVDNNCDAYTDEGSALDALIWYRDGDSDGFGDAATTSSACAPPLGYVGDDQDCDDTRGATYPGAPEVCDGLDQDCDGTIDDGAFTTWYLDGDGDRYGDPSSPVESCLAPAGYVGVGDDCNDADASANPAGVEVCDGVDQDCDSDVDEDVMSTWYLDADGDNHGDPLITTEACDAPAGYVAVGDDCDDSNGSRNCPGW